MKKIVLSLAVLAALLPFSFAAGEEVKSLRGGAIDGPEDAPGSVDWQAREGTTNRTFIHQPPVIPHSIEGFVITAEQNHCLICHGAGGGVPKPFKTHYLNRDGQVTEKIAERWWFCTQCHVGQAEREPMVESSFVHEPPVSPYAISGFSINAEQNQCLLCHGVEGAGAPKPSKTHYDEQDGKKIAKSRWFCNQCHKGKEGRKPPVPGNSVEKKK